MISATYFEASGFSPFAAEIRDHALIPAPRASRWIADLAFYNTHEREEFRSGDGIAASHWFTGAPVRRDRWNTPPATTPASFGG
jgi:hypothetical protein